MHVRSNGRGVEEVRLARAKKGSQRPKDRSTLVAASLGLVVIAGGLFAGGALDPVVDDAVALVKARTAPQAPPELEADKVVDWMYYEDVPEWSSMRGIPQVKRPSKPVEPGLPEDIAPPEHPHRVIISGPPPMPEVKLQPPDDCMQPHNPVSGVANFVVQATGGGRVTVRWWDMGDPDTQRYEVVAVPEYVNQFDYTRNVPDPQKRFTVVQPADGCQQMRTAVTGLQAGVKYSITLQAVNRSPLNSNRVYSITRARSEVITAR